VVRFPAQATHFSLHRSIKTDSGVHSASYFGGTGGKALKLTAHLLIQTRQERVELYINFIKPVSMLFIYASMDVSTSLRIYSADNARLNTQGILEY